MRKLRTILLLVLLAGLMVPRHACCFILSLGQEKPAKASCPCCVQTSKAPSEQEPLRPVQDGPCCRYADQILYQDASIRDFDIPDALPFWITPLSIHFAHSPAFSRVVGKSTSPPGSPVPVRVLFCHWTC